MGSGCVDGKKRIQAKQKGLDLEALAIFGILQINTMQPSQYFGPGQMLEVAVWLLSFLLASW